MISSDARALLFFTINTYERINIVSNSGHLKELLFAAFEYELPQANSQFDQSERENPHYIVYRAHYYSLINIHNA